VIDLKGQFIPTGLATGCTVARDGKSITFALRKGVKFHDGTDWNAQSAKWNLNTAWQLKLRGTEYWTSIDTVDDYTVRINISRFQTKIIAALSSTTGYIISPTAFQKNGKEWARFNPVGTGLLSSRVLRGMSLWNMRGSTTTGGKALSRWGEISICRGPHVVVGGIPGQRGRCPRGKKCHCRESAEGNGNYDVHWGIVAMGTLNGDSANPDSPYANLKVRQAVEHAIDRRALVEAMGYGFQVYTNQPAVPGFMGYIDNFQGRPYNPQRAKQLLSEAGYPNGFTTTLIGYTAIPEETLVAIQKYLSDVGITAKVENVTTVAWNDYVYKGWHNALLYFGMGNNPNYIVALDMFFAPTSLG